MMGRGINEIGRVYSNLLRAHLRTLSKKIPKSQPTQPPQKSLNCDKGPFPPALSCCSASPCASSHQKPKLEEPCANSPAPVCNLSNPQSDAPASQSDALAPQENVSLYGPFHSCPSCATGGLGEYSLEAYSPCGLNSYCVYCQQPIQQYPNSCNGSVQFDSPSHRIVCCCCPTCGSPPFNMTGPPPCCAVQYPSYYSALPSYGVPTSYGSAVSYGAVPYYGANPCYGNQFYQYANPYSQSNIDTADKIPQGLADKIPQELTDVGKPQEHSPLQNKKDMQRQQLNSK